MAIMHKEEHFSERIGWLRAAVLGANDGIVSTSSLVVGIAAANSGRHDILLAAVAGLFAGAMSMAAGEYVSVSSQADTEQADMEREQFELDNYPEEEHEELSVIYQERGLKKELADEVATKLMEHDALGTHLREELGITEIQLARPVQAAIASALSFASGALLPVLLVLFAPLEHLGSIVTVASLFFLAFLGFLAAKLGGANPVKAAIRVTFWSALAFGVTAGVGHLFGISV